jgi:RNA polymerase sigma factor (sigma-70 family)
LNDDDDTRERRFSRLYDEHVEAVRRYAWRRDPALTDDIVAETFLVAWRRLDDVPVSTRPWLIGVARNTRLNLRRSAQRQRAVAERMTEATPRITADGDDAEASEVVHAALARLPERDREVLTLSVWDDLDRASIAKVLGCSQANVSLRLHRAHRRFVAEIERRDPSTGPCPSPSPLPGGRDV